MALRLNSLVLTKVRPLINIRQISTSKKNDDTAAACAPVKKEVCPKRENWISYGFHRKDKTHDRQALHAILFSTISVALVGTIYTIMYAPDLNLRDWAQREAFLELRRREANGLPAIDRNIVNPSKVKLPSDKELGDTEIII